MRGIMQSVTNPLGAHCVVASMSAVAARVYGAMFGELAR